MQQTTKRPQSPSQTRARRVPYSAFKPSPDAAGGGREGRSPDVQSPTDNYSGKATDTDSKWAKIEWLRVNSVVKRQRTCMTKAHGDTVTLKRGSEGMTFGGVMQCGSRLCPVCGPKISAANRAAITEAVDKWQASGGTVLFGTFTLRHKRGQAFTELSEGISTCWKAVTTGRRWARERRLHGVEHFIRVYEEKFNPHTGWHLHIHYLLFVADGFTPDADELLTGMFDRWKNAAVGLGLGKPSWLGQDLRTVTEFAATKLGKYLAKQTDGTEAKAVGSGKKLGYELTLRDGKFSAVSVTPGELLSMAVSGLDPWAAALWSEYELGMHKRRAIAFSMGLRAALELDAPLSDVEAATLAADLEGVTELTLRGADYSKIARAGWRRELLAVAWSSADEAILWLHDRGVYAWKVKQDTHCRFIDAETPEGFAGVLPF